MNNRQADRLRRLILAHGRVMIKIEFQTDETFPAEDQKPYFKWRIIDETGYCKYRADDKKPKDSGESSRWWGSCFMEPKFNRTLKTTLKYMREHDAPDGKLAAVYVGPKFGRKVAL